MQVEAKLLGAVRATRLLPRNVSDRLPQVTSADLIPLLSELAEHAVRVRERLLELQQARL